MSEKLVTAAKKVSKVAKLLKMVSDCIIRKGGGNGGETDAGDGVAWSPDVDQSSAGATGD